MDLDPRTVHSFEQFGGATLEMAAALAAFYHRLIELDMPAAVATQLTVDLMLAVVRGDATGGGDG